MDTAEETSSPVTNVVAKGKRTKRPRLCTMLTTQATSSSSSIEDWGRSREELEEEEDMANCLILLARGRSVSRPTETGTGVTTEKLTNGKGGGGGGGGTDVYECKTCSKCFPSFQALGGHRTSHRKSKPVLTSDSIQLSMNSFSGVGKMTRVHECSICGSEFASGQALGGHMRRHRPVSLSETVGEEKKGRTKIVLSLDLNLPAPMEDCISVCGTVPAISPAGGGEFSFGSNLLRRSGVMDCQY